MKQVKRMLSLLLAVMMTVSLLTVSTSAATSTSDRETTARVLFALGLFKGYDNSGTNFGLSDGATREQSLLFLIRILGEEKAAEAWTGAQPYSDVAPNNYFRPYIGYAKAMGYTNGIGNNSFGFGQSASMTQMAAFALRGLGYSEAAGDFTFPNSVPFAVSLGIMDASITPSAFTRGDALEILDGAVATKVKNQSYTLLEKLVSSGAVTQAQVEKAAAIANGTTPGKGDIAAGTYTLKCMGNSLRITSDKLTLRDTVPAQKFTITNKDGYSYIQTAEGYYIGVTDLNKGTQPVLGTTPYSWLIQKVSSGVYTIRPAEKPEMLVCAGEASGQNGTQLLLWPHTDNAQHGRITFTDSSKNVAVTGIKLDQSTAKLTVGKKLQLTGSISPANATNQTVTWTSSSSTIAQVNSDGLVTGMKAGTATITAKTIDGSKTAKCKVTVSATAAYTDKLVHLYNSDGWAATDIRISSSMDNDWGENLISEPLQPNATVDILVPVSSSDYVYDMAIAYADGTKATFVGYNFKIFTSGNILYTYMAADKLRLTITKPLSNVVLATGIAVDQTSAKLTVGQTLKLKATIAPANATSKSVLWSCNNLAAKVDGNGLVTAMKPGTAIISAKTADGARVATCTVTVTADPNAVYADKTLRLYNSSKQAATDIRISSAQNAKWGENLLSGLLQPNASVEILIPVSGSDYMYDIAIVYADGSTSTFAGYNFRTFNSGNALYAYIDNGTPTLSTTKPAADTTAASKTLKTRYDKAVTRFNATETKLENAGLYKGELKTAWDKAATQLNTELGFIAGGSVYTASQISTANAILTEVDTMLNEMDTLIAEVSKAQTPTSNKKTITIVNNTGVTFASINMSPDTAASYDPVSNSNLKQGESVTVTIDFTGKSSVWDMQIFDPNHSAIEFKGIDFTKCPTTGGTITLTLSADGRTGTATISW